MATNEPTLTQDLSTLTTSERRRPYERPAITKGRPVEAATLTGHGGSKGQGNTGAGNTGAGNTGGGI